MSSLNFFRGESYPVSEQRDMNISELERRLDEGDMVVPGYQREYVWTKKQQQGYLKSISQGFPLFGPVINLDMDTGVLEIKDGTSHKFSDYPDNQQRKFRNKRIAYLETQSWTEEDCQDFFVTMNGGGVTLKAGELIHADLSNIFTKSVMRLSDKDGEYGDFLSTSAKKGGIGMTANHIKRYFHYEFMGTLFHMVRTLEFPLRPGKTAKGEMELWRSQGEGPVFLDTLTTMRLLIDSYIEHMTKVPRLSEKLESKNHLRLLYFLFKKGCHIKKLDDEHFAKIDSILNTVLNKKTVEYKEIITWGTTDCMKIYDKYGEIYAQ
jgi:hypothetical protein